MKAEGRCDKMKDMLRPYVPVADMLVQTLGSDCEVVLHDLDDPTHSVVYVAGSVTGRKPGDSFDQLVRQVLLSGELREDYVANYFFTAPNGREIRSSTVLIKDAHGALQGALCVNLDTTRLARQVAFLQSFLPAGQTEKPVTEQPPEHIARMIENLMDQIIGAEDPRALSRENRVEKVRFMDSKGIFLMKGSVEKAAEKLGVNKVTIYSYLDEIRGKKG